MNTIKYLNNLKVPICEVRSSLSNKRIKWCDDRTDYSNDTPDIMRVILFSDKFQSDFKNPMIAECNGLVVQYTHGMQIPWKIISYPPHCFNMKLLSPMKINKYCATGSYSLYDALDGTILTLYYFNNEWRISSYKGYDVTYLNFGHTYTTLKQCCDESSNTVELISVPNEKNTYIDILNKTLANYPNFDYSKLNTSTCYTICLRYDKYHIFNEPGENNYIYFIQSVDLSSNKIVINTEEDIGLPIKYPLNNKDITIGALNNNLKQNFNKIDKEIKLTNALTIKPLYGYILRSKHADHEYRNIFIEGPLMKYIRIALYNQPKKNNTYETRATSGDIKHRKEIQSSDTDVSLIYPKDFSNNILLIQLSTFLNRTVYSKYYRIFKQFVPFYDKLMILTKKIIPDIIINGQIKPEYEQYIGNQKYFDILVKIIMQSMASKKIFIKQINENKNNIIYDYIHNVMFLHEFYSYMMSDSIWLSASQDTYQHTCAVKAN